MSYEVVSIPVGDSHSMQTWWDGDVPIASVEVNAENILALTVFEKQRGKGHGKAIAKILINEGLKPVNIKQSAKRFWQKAIAA